MNNWKELERNFLRILKNELSNRFKSSNPKDELIQSLKKIETFESSLIRAWIVEIFKEVKEFNEFMEKKATLIKNLKNI